MDDLLREYLGLAIGLGLFLILAAWVLAVRNPDSEKISAYECGFNAFDDARMKFDVRFYLVSILFIIFDLEIAMLFPWAAAFGGLSDTAWACSRSVLPMNGRRGRWNGNEHRRHGRGG